MQSMHAFIERTELVYGCKTTKTFELASAFGIVGLLIFAELL